MHLARQYRLKFATQRSDRLVLYLASAVAFHLGLMTIGLKAWQVETTQATSEPLQPIEFVYLKGESAQSTGVGQISNIDSQAGGENRPDLAIAAGKPEELKPAETAQSKPLAPQQSAGAYVPTYSQSTNQEKAVEAEPTEKPEPTRAQSGAVQSSTAQPSIVQSAASGVPSVATPTPAKPEALNPEPSQSTTPPASVQPVAPATDQDTDEVSPPGFGLDGLLNPDRTAINRPGIDAQRDEIWGEYRAALTERIYQQWRSINPDVTRETLIRFEIDRQGHVTAMQVTQSSGSEDADQTAIDAIEAAAPFGPFPTSVNHSSVVINFRFTHNVRSPRR